jgi:hypothetical protein
LVVDFAARPSAFHVRYAPAVYSEGKGDLLPLRGGALLDVVLLTTSVDSKTGAPTHHPGKLRRAGQRRRMAHLPS